MCKIKNALNALIVIGTVLMLNACVVVKTSPNYRAPTRADASYHYWYYYPNIGVYYQIVEHYYYYPYGGTWRRATRLPDGWVLDDRDRVRLRISGVPYSNHVEHQRRYPPRNMVRSKPDKNPHMEREYKDTRRHERDHDEDLHRDHDKGGSREHRPDYAGHERSNGGSREQTYIKREKETRPEHARHDDAHERSRLHREYPSERERSMQDNNRGAINNAKPGNPASGKFQRGRTENPHPRQNAQQSENANKPSLPGVKEQRMKNQGIKNQSKKNQSKKNQSHLPQNTAKDKQNEQYQAGDEHRNQKGGHRKQDTQSNGKRHGNKKAKTNDNNVEPSSDEDRSNNQDVGLDDQKRRGRGR